MKKIVKYTTAQDNDSRGLDKRVTNLIDMGYQPYGAPYSAYNGRSVTLCQALVKYEGDEDAQPETPTRDTPAMQTPLKEAPSNAPKESPKLKSETSRLQIKPSAQPSIPPPPLHRRRIALPLRHLRLPRPRERNRRPSSSNRSTKAGRELESNRLIAAACLRRRDRRSFGCPDGKSSTPFERKRSPESPPIPSLSSLLKHNARSPRPSRTGSPCRACGWRFPPLQTPACPLQSRARSNAPPWSPDQRSTRSPLR